LIVVVDHTNCEGLMPSKLCKWGNSLGVRLPQYVVERSGVRAGDYLFIRLTDSGEIVVRPVKPRDVHAAFQVSACAVNPPSSSPQESPEKW
jgi:antitoxin component of MazEF toxin-antitoxin module